MGSLSWLKHDVCAEAVGDRGLAVTDASDRGAWRRRATHWSLHLAFEPPYIRGFANARRRRTAFISGGEAPSISTRPLQIALTFDDGPSPYYTPQVLDILRRYQVVATFFCIGRAITAHPDLLVEIAEAGHMVANHSWSHPAMPFLSNSEIRFELERTSRTIEESIGILPTYFRAPYGLCDRRVFAEATKLGITTVRWDVRATDWAEPGVDVISHRIVNRAHPGGVILLHDGGGDRSQTVAALPSIIETLHEQGYQFVTLDKIRTGSDTAGTTVPRITDALVRDLPLVHDLIAHLRQRARSWITSKR